MWISHSEQIDSQTTRVTLGEDSRVLSCREVVDLWQRDAAFRKFFNEVLSQTPYEAFFWETAPITKRTWDHGFEFVMVEGASLSRLTPDPSAFASHFQLGKSEKVILFPNLGGDALLVVPAPVAAADCYTHLSRFVRFAPRSQVDDLWRTVGTAMESRISDKPTWLNTSGLGVSWLHLRLDSRPKYYHHEPYKNS